MGTQLVTMSKQTRLHWLSNYLHISNKDKLKKVKTPEVFLLQPIPTKLDSGPSDTPLTDFRSPSTVL